MTEQKNKNGERPGTHSYIWYQGIEILALAAAMAVTLVKLYVRREPGVPSWFWIALLLALFVMLYADMGNRNDHASFRHAWKIPLWITLLGIAAMGGWMLYRYDSGSWSSEDLWMLSVILYGYLILRCIWNIHCWRKCRPDGYRTMRDFLADHPECGKYVVEYRKYF